MLADPEQDLIGQRIGQYVLLNVLGRGQFSRVQLAIDTATQARVAIKILLKENISSGQLNKEILIHRTLTSQSHVNIIRFIGQLEDASRYYLVLEWAGGGELFDLIEPDVGLHPDLAHFYFVQLIQTLVRRGGGGVVRLECQICIPPSHVVSCVGVLARPRGGS